MVSDSTYAHTLTTPERNWHWDLTGVDRKYRHSRKFGTKKHTLSCRFSHNQQDEVAVEISEEDRTKCNTLPRLYVGDSELARVSSTLFHGSRVELSSEQTHYLTKVMRFFFKQKKRAPTSNNVVKIGGEMIDLSSCVRIFDGLNGEWLAKVIDPTMTSNFHQTSKKARRDVVSNVLEAQCVTQLKLQSSQHASQLWVIFAPIKKQRLKLLVEKCTELGADYFCPVITDHTDSIDNVGDRDIKKLSLVASEAAEQSERLSIPKFLKGEVDVVDTSSKNSNDASPPSSDSLCANHIDLQQLLEDFVSSSSHEKSTLLVCRERRDNTISILEAYSIIKEAKREKTLILVGPEGGWSEKENILLDDYGFKYPEKISCVSLGNSVLRAETAAISAVAAHTFWRDFAK